jgi:hypothetical protein
MVSLLHKVVFFCASLMEQKHVVKVSSSVPGSDVALRHHVVAATIDDKFELLAKADGHWHFEGVACFVVNAVKLLAPGSFLRSLAEFAKKLDTCMTFDLESSQT